MTVHKAIKITDLTITERILNGESLKTLAKEHIISEKLVYHLIHKTCLHLNPELYRSGIRMHPTILKEYPPYLGWLRGHKQFFFKV